MVKSVHKSMFNTTIPGFARPEDYVEAARVLEANGFREQAILEALDISDLVSLVDRDMPVWMRRTAGGRRVDTLIRLFLMGVPVDVAAANAAFAPMPIEKWIEANVLRAAGNEVVSAIRMLPYRGIWLAADRSREPGVELATDFVMGFGTSTITLSNITIRQGVHSMLDLGCGCGTHAIFASPHVEEVFALDINPRAVGMTKFNVALNGLKNVTVLQGDLFAPVAGRKFDLIITNPPFVISPSSRYIYRDGGLPGDGFVRRLIQEAPAYLNEDGYCQMLCNWALKKNEDWRTRLPQWFAGTGCDAWVLCSETREVMTYAATWIRQTETDDPKVYARLFPEWMAYYAEQGIDRIGAGAIILRKSNKPKNWVQCEEAPASMYGPCGNDIALGFALRDFLEETPDAQLLATSLRVSPVVRLQQKFRPSDGAWMAEESEFIRVEGMTYRGNADMYIAGIVARCDGHRPLGDLIVELANALEKEPATVIGIVLPVIRGLIERGFLMPPSQTSPAPPPPAARP